LVAAAHFNDSAREQVMAYHYAIDHSRHVVYVRMSGPLMLAEIQQLVDTLAADPEVQPGFCELIDLREATTDAVSAEDVRRLAAATLDNAQRRAFVTTDTLTYGLARMFEVYRSLNRKSDTIAVFRHIKDAEAWLGLTPSETVG
jgi:hypothetical protein